MGLLLARGLVAGSSVDHIPRIPVVPVFIAGLLLFCIVFDVIRKNERYHRYFVKDWWC